MCLHSWNLVIARTCLTPFKEIENYDTLGPRKLTFHKKDTNTVFKFYDSGICIIAIWMKILTLMQCVYISLRMSNHCKDRMKLTPDCDASRLYELICRGFQKSSYSHNPFWCSRYTMQSGSIIIIIVNQEVFLTMLCICNRMSPWTYILFCCEK